MSQISPPLRIALVAVVALLAAWMLVLRPRTQVVTPASDAVAPAATPAGNLATGKPAESAAGKLAEQAKHAAQQEAGKVEAASGLKPSTAAAPAAVAATSDAKAAGLAAETSLSKTALAALPSSIARALVDRRVIVLGVVSSATGAARPADDRAVATALHHVDTYRGDVLVRTASVEDIAAYGPVVNALHVNQTPSIVVIDRDRKATVLAGYQDGQAIDQAIVDARRASTPHLLPSSYLKALNTTCTTYSTLLVRSTSPAKDERVAGRRAAALRALKPTGTYRSLDKRIAKAAKGSTDVTLAPSGTALGKALDRAGVTACTA